jgi:hypothetical protein
VLQPEVVGSHGETVLRLMRPGLHSGTLPKVYARLRRGKGWRARRQYEALHHVREALQHFAERNLVAVLSHSKDWAAAAPAVGEIKLGSTRLRIELRGPGGAGGSVSVDFEEHGGWLTAGLGRPAGADGEGGTWLDGLTSAQRLVLRDALAGFYKQAGVALVREQIAAALATGAPYAIGGPGLVVWPGDGLASEAVYELDGAAEVSPRWRAGPPGSGLRKLPAADLFFRAVPVRWDDWVRTWEEDGAGRGHPPLLPASVRLLPDEPASPGVAVEPR